ncbi:hydroxymethylglutaryl-CoA lyase [Namhaeicola litoreus]|uniref:Hydroxymethylglutaryl-CoA lyase n=1 Tax=Namhaeicola litoreus TaxID=1052145 RepID=A0ABW3Y205_9FLAO
MKKVKIIECPRDAMQGITERFIPTEDKITYINALLKVGFDTLDFGSFVSPKAIPQMRDSAEVLSELDVKNSRTKLLAIVANLRGAEEACKFSEIRYIGYPFSISEIFQMRNTGKTIEESVSLLTDLLTICKNHNKELVAYLSMGFGNPYGDPWSVEIVSNWVKRLSDLGVKILSLSDTVGMADEITISELFCNLIPLYPEIEFGAHLHTHPRNWFAKVDAAFGAGCYRFDGAILGFGGCPMAKDELTGNMPTEKLITYFSAKKIDISLNLLRFESAYNEALKIFKGI